MQGFEGIPVRNRPHVKSFIYYIVLFLPEIYIPYDRNCIDGSLVEIGDTSNSG